MGETVSDSKLIGSLLADLQERQYLETEQYLQKMEQQVSHPTLI